MWLYAAPTLMGVAMLLVGALAWLNYKDREEGYNVELLRSAMFGASLVTFGGGGFWIFNSL